MPGLWFDGFDAPELDVELPKKVQFRGWLVCVLGHSDDGDCWREPVEFELRLCPRSGRFQGYRFRVGDSRPRQEKRVGGLEIGMSRRIDFEPFRIVNLEPQAPIPVGDWQDEFVRGDFPNEKLQAET